MTMLHTLRAARVVLVRDVLLALRRVGDVLTTVFFFVIVVSLFPLGLDPAADVLRTMAPAVIWVAALLASMLSLGRLFSADYGDGTLEQMVIAPHPLSLLVLSKVAAHWALAGLPLVVMAPLLGMQFGLPAPAIAVLMVALVLGTAVLSFLGAIGAALTLGLRGGGVLLSLLILPLYVPVLIFGAGAVDASMSGLGAQGPLAVLGALLVLAVVFVPWVTAAALRISIE